MGAKCDMIATRIKQTGTPFKVGDLVARRCAGRPTFVGVLERLFCHAGDMVAHLRRADGRQLALTASRISRATVADEIEHVLMGGTLR